MVGFIILQLTVAVLLGVSLGCLGWFFKFIKNQTLSMYLKFIYSVSIAIGFVLFS